MSYVILELGLTSWEDALVQVWSIPEIIESVRCNHRVFEIMIQLLRRLMVITGIDRLVHDVRIGLHGRVFELLDILFIDLIIIIVDRSQRGILRLDLVEELCR